jgi:hypothetical protein
MQEPDLIYQNKQLMAVGAGSRQAEAVGRDLMRDGVRYRIARPELGHEVPACWS